MPTTSSSSRVPRATYRLQFHRGFTLRQGQELIPYLHQLGVSHVYASPLLKAQPGSTHGYDVCDFSRLNPEIGTDEDFAAFVETLREHGMGLVLDFVPNHAGIGGPQNPWWWDVLRHGSASRYARHFDIDWESPDPRLRGKVLVPVLGDRYDRVLTKGELRLEISPEQGLVVRYFDHQFPLAPESYDPKVPESAKNIEQINTSPDKLDAILRQQHYRLTDWRHGDAELNYRRFFTITSLAGLRVEDPAVFGDVHARIREWHTQGLVDGIRIDHPDGLADPEGYLRQLRATFPKTWIVIEKILEPGESLPVDWPVAGTTGYDFLNRVGGLFIAPEGEPSLTDFYAEFTGQPTECAAVVRENKRLVLREMFAAEVGKLTRLLQQIGARHWPCRDFTADEMRETICELIANFPVYRTYSRAEDKGVSAIDGAYITQAVAAAREQRPKLSPDLLEFLRTLLSRRLGQSHDDAEDEFVLRFQQLTGPAMAKGVEDTTFYCYNRFVALNEVGGDSGHFGLSVEAFHQQCAEAQAHWPNAMLASSTHDTKRSEDVRARLGLLSEMPEAWIAAVRRWSAHNVRYKQRGFPDANAEYLYYQTLVGAWPLSAQRATAYMEKASREAKQHTNWTEANQVYDEALRRFVSKTLDDADFTDDLARFVEPLIEPGQINSLSQTLIKLTAPGVPDIYQGTELWDLSLVDPDNRRPVDFDARRRLLTEIDRFTPEAAWQERASGLPKLWLIRKTLAVRQQHSDWFGAQSDYQPLYALGTKARHAVAFTRGGQVVTVSPRLVLGIPGDWVDTVLPLPDGNWRNEFTGETVPGGRCLVGNMLERFPVALLTRIN